MPQLLQQGAATCSNIATTFVHPTPEQAPQPPPPAPRQNLAPIHPLMFFPIFFCVCLFFFFFFFAVGLFNFPTTMQVHPNLCCICPSHSLSKQTTNIFIKYYLQNGHKDLPPLKATCLYTTLVNNPPSSRSILNELCVSHTTQVTHVNKLKKVYYAPENNSIYSKQQRWMFSWRYSTRAGDSGDAVKGTAFNSLVPKQEQRIGSSISNRNFHVYYSNRSRAGL